jgi:hypothetical protein
VAQAGGGRGAKDTLQKHRTLKTHPTRASNDIGAPSSGTVPSSSWLVCVLGCGTFSVSAWDCTRGASPKFSPSAALAPSVAAPPSGLAAPRCHVTAPREAA